MDTQRHDIAAFSRDGMWLTIRELLNPGSIPFDGTRRKFEQLELSEFRTLPSAPPPPPPGTSATPPQAGESASSKQSELL
jgi:hypothetical protein